MEVFVDVLLVGLGVALLVFNDKIGAALYVLYATFWTESAFSPKVVKPVYRAMICVFATALLIAAGNDLWAKYRARY